MLTHIDRAMPKRARAYSHLAAWSGVAISVFVVGCAAVATKADPRTSVTPATEVWKLPPLRGLEHGWVAPGHDLSADRIIWVEPLRTRTDPIEPAVLGEMQALLEKTLRRSGKQIDPGGLRFTGTVYWDTRTIMDHTGGLLHDERHQRYTFPVVAMDFVIIDEQSGDTLAKGRHFVQRSTPPDLAMTDLIEDVARLLTERP